jgi:hypothetical protein
MINRKFAIHLLDLCNYSYLNKDDCKVTIEGLGYKDFKFFESKNSQAFGATKDGEVYIVFRGTQFIHDPEIEDIMASFKTSRVLFQNKFVHSGYYEYYSNIRDQIHQYLDLFPHLEKVFIGYSIGGAAACFLGLEYDGQVYAFASPRSFGKCFEDNETITNIQYNKDVLTQLPFGLNKFKHIGKTMILKKDGSMSENGSFTNAFNKLKLTTIALIMVPIIGFKIGLLVAHYFYKNHDSNTYIKLLKDSNEN